MFTFSVISEQDFWNYLTGVSVKFLTLGEINSMVGYHLMAKDHPVQLGVLEVLTPPAGAGQCPGGS